MTERHRHEPSTEPFEDPLADYEPPAYADDLERTLGEEKVKAIQSTPVATVPPDATIEQVMRKMAREKIACVLVVEGDRLAGIFTERDVLNKAAGRFSEVRGLPVSEVMSVDPVAVYETDTVAAALSAIATGGHRHVPVLDVNDRVAGIVGPQRVTAFLLQHFESSPRS